MFKPNKPTQTITNTVRGFTLIELLVALTIFAMLALMGWQVFNSVIKSRDTAKHHAQVLEQLQYTYMQLQRDLNQLVVYAIPSDSSFKPTLMLGTKSLQFVSLSTPDPRYTSQAGLQKLEYTFTNEQLVRQKYTPLNDNNQQPIQSILLTEVKDLTFTAFNPEPTGFWPPLEASIPTPQSGNQINLAAYQQLPAGIGIRFTYQDIPINWRFVLPKPTQQTIATQTE